MSKNVSSTRIIGAPWSYRQSDQTIWSGKGADEFQVAGVRGWGHLQYLENGADIQDAHGRLMAAAPELLEALKEVIRVFDSNPSSITDTVWVSTGMPETLYDHCLAAIAEAEERLDE